MIIIAFSTSDGTGVVFPGHSSDGGGGGGRRSPRCPRHRHHRRHCIGQVNVVHIQETQGP